MLHATSARRACVVLWERVPAYFGHASLGMSSQMPEPSCPDPFEEALPGQAPRATSSTQPQSRARAWVLGLAEGLAFRETPPGQAPRATSSEPKSRIDGGKEGLALPHMVEHEHKPELHRVGQPGFPLAGPCTRPPSPAESTAAPRATSTAEVFYGRPPQPQSRVRARIFGWEEGLAFEETPPGQAPRATSSEPQSRLEGGKHEHEHELERGWEAEHDRWWEAEHIVEHELEPELHRVASSANPLLPLPPPLSSQVVEILAATNEGDLEETGLDMRSPSRQKPESKVWIDGGESGLGPRVWTDENLLRNIQEEPEEVEPEEEPWEGPSKFLWRLPLMPPPGVPPETLEAAIVMDLREITEIRLRSVQAMKLWNFFRPETRHFKGCTRLQELCRRVQKAIKDEVGLGFRV